MDFKKLKYFLAVAEELHIGRAATRLDIAQPPLSRQIAALEEELGVLLFDRARSQIRLTQAGSVLQDHARQVLDRLDAALHETRLVGSGAAGRLRIGFVGSASCGVLPGLIKAYRGCNPGVELGLSAMNNADLHRALVQRELDIAVARPALDDDEFRRELLCTEPLVLALPEGSELGARPEIRMADLCDQTFVLYPRQPAPGHAEAVLDICAREGVTPRCRELAQDFEAAISLVSVGVGIAVVPESAACAQRPGVVFRSYEGHNPGTRLTVHARLDNRAPQVVQFLETTRKFARAC